MLEVERDPKVFTLAEVPNGRRATARESPCSSRVRDRAGRDCSGHHSRAQSACSRNRVQSILLGNWDSPPICIAQQGFHHMRKWKRAHSIAIHQGGAAGKAEHHQ